MPSTIDVQLQDRDLTLLKGLFESRIMTVRHMSAIFFDGHFEAVRKRVRRLREAGYLAERTRKVQDTAIFSITRRSYDALAHAGLFVERRNASWLSTQKRLHVAESTLRHELEVMDVKAAFYDAVRHRPTLRLTEFITWPQRIAFNAFHPATGAKVVVKPDGFVQIEEGRQEDNSRQHRFFIEVDRSTEVLDTLVNRMCSYQSFYKHGGLAERFGGSREAYREFPFRVLIVCKSEERRDNLAVRLLATDPPIRSFAWLTTMQEALTDPLGPIWVRPVDYKNAIAGTNFAAFTSRQLGKYRRQVERDTLVEAEVTKHRLLEA
jgi:hypothetical protein